MRKFLIPTIIALFLAVFLLNSMGVIEFGIGHLIARLWPIIPVWIGYNLLRAKENYKKKSGIVLTIMGVFLLVLNITVLFFESQDYIFQIFFTGLLTFWPVLILFLVLMVLLSWFDRGEDVYRSRFRTKLYDDVDLSKLDSTLIAQFGKLVFTINARDLTHRAIRLDIIAVFGVVEVYIPEQVSLLAENKTRIGTFNIFGNSSKKIIGQQVVEVGSDSESATRVLLRTKSWFGKVVVKKLR